MSAARLWSNSWRLNCFFISSYPLVFVGLSLLCFLVVVCGVFVSFFFIFWGEGVSYRLCGLSD